MTHDTSIALLIDADNSPSGKIEEILQQGNNNASDFFSNDSCTDNYSLRCQSPPYCCCPTGAAAEF